MSESFYTEGEYLEQHPDWHVADAGWKAKHILKILSKNKISPATAIEIGCGAGAILHHLKKDLPSVPMEGYEISPQAFELSKQYEKPGLNYFMKGLDQISGEQKYDLALMIDVFEHVEDFYGFLKTSRDKAKHFVFHIPLDLSVQSVLRAAPILRKRKRLGHIHYFTKETALASLEDSGYTIIDWFYTASYNDLPAKSFKTRLARIPRRMAFFLNQDLCVRIMGGYSLMVLCDSGK